MEDKKIIYTEFKNDKAGCTEARQFLIAQGKWHPDVERRDGWEIVHIANQVVRLHNEKVMGWHPYDDI